MKTWMKKGWTFITVSLWSPLFEIEEGYVYIVSGSIGGMSKKLWGDKYTKRGGTTFVYIEKMLS